MLVCRRVYPPKAQDRVIEVMDTWLLKRPIPTSDERLPPRVELFDRLCTKLIEVDVEAFVAWLGIANEELQEMLD